MDTKKLLTFFSLFTSMGTLLCCALPALLVSLGLGAVMAGLASNVPGLIWVSEHKSAVFMFAALMLFMNGAILWTQRNAPCPIDLQEREVCLTGRRLSRNTYFVSVGVFVIGFFFAYLAPLV